MALFNIGFVQHILTVRRERRRCCLRIHETAWGQGEGSLQGPVAPSRAWAVLSDHQFPRLGRACCPEFPRGLVGNKIKGYHCLIDQKQNLFK